MLKAQLLRVVLLGLLACGVPAGDALAQRGARRPRQQKGAICGDPAAGCKTSAQFEPYDLPFRVSERAVIWESEPFYAVILKSVPTKDCEAFVPETEREQAQAVFPRNKVFTTRCPEAGFVYYTGLKPDVHIMAVYAGRTRAEAAGVLAKAKAAGKYPGAYLRRMSIGFNGT